MTAAPVTTEAMTAETITTEALTTESPTTEPVTTESPTTEPVTTESPTTEPVTTESPTTEPVTTESPTTEPVTTESPTTESMTTQALTTAVETTVPVTEMTTLEICTAEDSCEGHYTCNNVTQEKICNDGFRGVDCKERDYDGPVGQDDECPDNGNVCKNGATCFAKTCCCAPGYTDELCNTEINECDSDPCQNDGTCIDLVNLYVCSCPDGKYFTIYYYLLSITITILLFVRSI